MRLWNDCVKKPTGALDSFQHLLVVKLVALRRQGDLFQSIELGRRARAEPVATTGVLGKSSPCLLYADRQ